jgi:membrane protein DedA with SNARE-associated domain
MAPPPSHAPRALCRAPGPCETGAVQSPADFLARWHYLGLLLVILVEEAGVPLPVPGDLFIAAMGVLAHSGRAGFAATAAIVTGATVVGATVLYLVSRHAGRPLLLKVARRFGYTEAREARLEAWLLTRGATAVVVGRLVPGLRIVMTVVAGALRLPHRTFVVGTAIAGLVWSTIYFWLGYALGAGYERLAGRLPPEAIWTVAGALLARRARARRASAAEAGPLDPQP